MPFKRDNPGCCCVSCDNLPEQLYIRSLRYYPTKVPFTYDAASGKWLASMFATPTTSSGNLPASACKDNACGTSGTGTWLVYQMTAAKLVSRQVETCSMATGSPSNFPQNTLPADISGTNVFGVAGSGRGTYTQSGTAGCTENPLKLTVNLNPFTFIGVIVDSVEITDVP